METRVDQMQKILKERNMEILFARVAANLLEKDSVDEATRICEEGVKKFPVYAQGHFVMARCYLQKNKVNEARAELERTLKFDPVHPRALLMLARINKEEGRAETAKEYLKRLIMLDPLNKNLMMMDQSGDIGMEDGPGAAGEEKTGPGTGQSPAGKPEAGIDRMDLSQFDNTEDDFTTILTGQDQEEESEEEAAEEKPAAAQHAPAGSEESPEDLNGEDYEDLDELNFDAEESAEDTEREPWIQPTSERDATEILMRRDQQKQQQEPAEPAAAVPEDDSETEADSSTPTHPKIVSQTLGEILVSQKKYPEALKVFEALKEQHPENVNLDKKIDFLKKIISLERK